MGGDAGGDFDLCDCDGGGVCGFEFSERGRLVESFGERGAPCWDILFIVFFLEREVGGRRRLVIVSGDWAKFGEVGAGAGGVVSGEFFGWVGDVAGEEKEDCLWAVSGGGVCDDICVFRCAFGDAGDEFLV